MTDDDRLGWWGVWLLDPDPDNLVDACHWIVAAGPTESSNEMICGRSHTKLR
jgi:hypothetical protein